MTSNGVGRLVLECVCTTNSTLETSAGCIRAVCVRDSPCPARAAVREGLGTCSRWWWSRTTSSRGSYATGMGRAYPYPTGLGAVPAGGDLRGPCGNAQTFCPLRGDKRGKGEGRANRRMKPPRRTNQGYMYHIKLFLIGSVLILNSMLSNSSCN